MAIENRPPDHYPNASTRLNEGDEIRVMYVGDDVAKFGAKTFKRLFGWILNTVFIGDVSGGSVRFRNEKGENQCRHCVYNIEILIAQQRLRLLNVKRANRQLTLW